MAWTPPEDWINEEEEEEEFDLNNLVEITEPEEPEEEPKKPGIFSRIAGLFRESIPEPEEEFPLYDVEPGEKKKKPGFIRGEKITKEEELEKVLPPWMTKGMAERVVSGEAYEDLSEYRKRKADEEKKKRRDAIKRPTVEEDPKQIKHKIADMLTSAEAGLDLDEQEEISELDKAKEEIENPPTKGKVFIEGTKATIRSDLYGIYALTQMGEYRRQELMSKAPPKELRIIPGWTPPTAIKPEVRQAIRAAAASEILKADPDFEMPEGFVDNFIFTFPQLAKQIMTSVMGGRMIGMGAMFLQIGGSTYKDLIDQGVPEQSAISHAVMNGLAQAPMEWFAFSKGLKFFKLRNGMAPKLRHLLDASGSEYATEFSQEFVDELVNFWATNPDKNKLEGFNHLIDQFLPIAKRGHMAGLVAATIPFTFGSANMASHGIASRVANKTDIPEAEANAINRFCQMYLDGKLGVAQLRVLREEWPDGSHVQKGLDKLIGAIEHDQQEMESAVATAGSQEAMLNEQLENIEGERVALDDLVDQQLEETADLEENYMVHEEEEVTPEVTPEVAEGIEEEVIAEEVLKEEVFKIRKEYPEVTEKQAIELAQEPAEYKTRYKEIKKTYPGMTHKQIADVVAEEVEAKEKPLPKRIADLSTQQWAEITEEKKVPAPLKGQISMSLMGDNEEAFEGTEVADKKGKPLVMYHGTSGVFAIEDMEPSLGKSGGIGEGFYFTQDPTVTDLALSRKKARGANVMPVYLRMFNPFEAKAKKGDKNYEFLLSNKDKSSALLEAEGYDGILLRDKRGIIVEAVAFDRDQIQSIFEKHEPGPTTVKSIKDVQKYPKPSKELQEKWDKAVEVGRKAVGKLPVKTTYQGMFPETGHPDDPRSVIFTVESGPLKGDTLGMDINLVSDETINGLYQGRLLQAKGEAEEKAGTTAKSITSVRKRVARGSLHEQMPEYQKEIEKIGGPAKLRGYSIRHTRRFFVGKSKIYGPAKKTDIAKKVKKKHPLIGTVEYTEYHDKSGNLVLNTPILPVNPKKRLAEMVRLIQENQEHADWYLEWSKFMDKLNSSRMNKDEIAKRIKIQGLLSRGRSPRSNQLMYAHVMNQLEAGEELKFGKGHKIDKYEAEMIKAIWAGKDKDTNTLAERMDKYGNKVGSFIHLGLAPADPEAVVVDRHIARLFGYDVTKSYLKDKSTGEMLYHSQFVVTPDVKRQIDKAVTAAGKHLGLTSGQAQAALWFAARPDLAQVGEFREAAQIEPSKYLPVEEFKSTTEPAVMIIHYEEKQKGVIKPSPLLGRTHIYSKEVEARKEARTAMTDYVPFSDWYMAGTRPEPMMKGKKAHVVKVPYNQIYDLGRDPLGFVATARKRVENDPQAFPGNSAYLNNAIAHLIRESGDYVGFSTGRATGKWFHLFEAEAVEPEVKATIALSDTVESIQNIPQDVTKVDEMISTYTPVLEKHLADAIAKRHYPIKVKFGNPTIARFGDATSGKIEPGLSLQVEGPLSAIRAFASEAVGIQKAQRQVYVMHNEAEPNGIKIRYKVKQGVPLKVVDQAMKKAGLTDFNILKTEQGYHVDQFVPNEDTATAEKLLNVYDKIGVPESMSDYPIHSEILGDTDWTGKHEHAVNNYMKHITEYFGEDKGREISEEAVDEGEKYSGLAGLRKGYTLGAIAGEKRLQEGKAAPLRRALGVRKPEAKPTFTQEKFKFRLIRDEELKRQALEIEERISAIKKADTVIDKAAAAIGLTGDELSLRMQQDEMGASDFKIIPKEKLVDFRFKAIDDIVKGFGLDPVWFSSYQKPKLAGFADATNPGKIFLNTRAKYRNQMFMVAGHEVFHDWAFNHADDYDRLVTYFKAHHMDRKEYSKYYKDLVKRYRDEGLEIPNLKQIMNEYLADIAGEQFAKNEFWEQMSVKNPSLFKRIVDALSRILENMINVVKTQKGWKAKHYKQWSDGVKDLENMKETLVNIYAKYSKELEKGKPVYKPAAKPAPEQRTAFSITQSTYEDEDYREFIEAKIGKVKRTTKERFLEWFNNDAKKWKDALMDRLKPLERLDHELGITDRHMSAYIQARMETGTPAIMQTWLRHGGLTWDGFAPTVLKRSDGFFKLIEDLGKDADLFFQWKIAKRAEKLLKQGREHWFTQEDIDRIKDKAKDKAFKKFDIKYRQLNREVLDFAEASGIIDPEARSVWEDDEYIPFYRLISDAENMQSLRKGEEEFLTGPKKKRRFVDSQIKRLKGADEKIGDPIENILTNWTHLIRESVRNQTRKKALLYMTKAGYANVIKPAGKMGIAWEYMSEDDQARRVVGWWNQEGILNFMHGGKKYYYRVTDADLFNSLYGINTEAFNNVLIKAMGKAKRMLTWGVTIAPAFRVANFIRDTLHTFVVSRNFKPVVDSMRGFMRFMKEDDATIEMMASGGGFAQGYIRSDDPEEIAHFVKRMVKQSDSKGTTTLNTFSKVLNFWEKIGDAAENAARVQLYANLKAKGETTLVAGFEAKDLLDFSLSGNNGIVQYLIRVTPFLNARVQGLYRLGRGYGENKSGFLMKGAAVAAASMALWWLNKDDERYKELPDHEKFMYYHWWIGDHHFRMPKPFEVGALFSTLPEVLGDVLNKNEDSRHIWDYICATMRDTMNIEIFPQMIKPAVEVWLNKNFFTDRPIVGASIEGLKPGRQADPWTSSALRALGEKLNVSPKKMEHMMRGYLGFFGELVLAMTDVAYENMTDGPEPPKRRFDDNFFIGRFIREHPQRVTKHMHDFYEMVRASDELTKTINNYKKTGDKDKARKLASDEKWLKRHKGRINSLRAYLRRTNQRMRKIYYDKKMTPEEKKIAINKILDKRNKKMRAKYEDWAGEF